MSFDIFVGAFRQGEAAAFDRAIVENAFRSLIASRDHHGWTLTCDSVLHIRDTPTITGFTVNRPNFVAAFEDALYEVLRRAPAVLFWPGSGPHPRICAADPAIVPELPPDMIEALGTPAILASGAEIPACISGT